MKSIHLINKAFLLKKTSIFAPLDLDLLLTIADKMDLVLYKENDKIFVCDQEAQRMYLIVEGVISMRGKKGELLGELSDGELFGDESLLNEQPRGYNAICRSPVTLLMLSRTHLLSILSECPLVALALLEAYARHVEFRKR